MTRVLEEGGLEVVAQAGPPEAVIEEARELQPDAVVLGVDLDGSRDLRELVQEAAPRAKVILWARDETEMEVFDPGRVAPRRVRASPSEALLRELNVRRATERE
jgi:DNA-binding NarL/FixJ family response regulator